MTVIVLRLQGFRILQLCFVPSFLRFTTICKLRLSPYLFPKDHGNIRLHFHSLQSFSINLRSIAQRNESSQALMGLFIWISWKSGLGQEQEECWAFAGDYSYLYTLPVFVTSVGGWEIKSFGKTVCRLLSFDWVGGFVGAHLYLQPGS